MGALLDSEPHTESHPPPQTELVADAARQPGGHHIKASDQEVIIPPGLALTAHDGGPVIHGLGERDLMNPEGAGFDCRLARLSRLVGEGYVGVENRQTPEATEVEALDGPYALEPHTYYLATTREELDLPPNMAALVIPRSTLYRSGVILSGGLAAPGYRGTITVGIMNSRNDSFKIEPHARFLHVVFFALSSDANAYKGQWQGGRIDAPTTERQI